MADAVARVFYYKNKIEKKREMAKIIQNQV